MQPFHLLASVTFLACYFLALPFVGCLSHGDAGHSGKHKSMKENAHQLSAQMTSKIKLHGILLWVSLGFLMPLGILVIRMSNRQEGGRRVRILFYLHAILQMLAVLLASIGAIMSIRNFDNSFNNNHQRLGLALYGAMWVQALVGFFRPSRGNKRRTTWYIVHWILGTTISLVGIINIYTGLEAYGKRTSRSTGLLAVLFTVEVCLICFLYLFQDRWEYMQKQGVILGNVEPINAAADQGITDQRDNQKVVLPEPCSKRNALANLFD